MNSIDQLKSVLCDAAGKCCIAGSDEDRTIVDRALEALAQPEERNFCPRCGKRTADLTAIHTCTPPQPEQNQFKPDYDTEAVLVEEMQRVAKQIAEMQDWEAVALLRSAAITQAIPQILQGPLSKREWVGLTDDEIQEIVGPWGGMPIKGYTRKLFDQIEVALRGKNT